MYVYHTALAVHMIQLLAVLLWGCAKFCGVLSYVGAMELVDQSEDGAIRNGENGIEI